MPKLIFSRGGDTQLPQAFLSYQNLTVLRFHSWWSWNKWYSRHSMTAFISGNISRIQTHGRIANSIIERHWCRALRLCDSVVAIRAI